MVHNLKAMTAKASGSGTTGSHLSPEDRKTYDKLGNQTLVLRIKGLLESARQRDIDAIQILAKLAVLNHIESVYIEDKAKQPDAYLQIVLITLEKLYAAGTQALPLETETCTIGNALAHLQRETQKLVSDGNATDTGLRKNISDYLVAIELIKHMNNVSLLIHKLDMSDVEKAVASDDMAGMGASADAAIREGRVSPETAGEVRIWRNIDENYLSDVISRGQQMQPTKPQ